MNQQRLRRQHPRYLEQCDRRLSLRCDGDITSPQPVGKWPGAIAHEQHLGRTLRYMHRHRQRLAPRQRGRGREELARHRVRCVRRHPHAHQWRILRAGLEHASRELRDGPVALHRIGTEHFQISHAAHAVLAHRGEWRAGVRGVGETGDSVTQCFPDAGPRGIEQHALGHEITAHRRERAEPVAEIESLEKAAQQGELEMRVGIHEPRHEHRISQGHRAHGARRDRHGTRRPHELDPPRLHHHRTVANGCRRDRQHPVRGVQRAVSHAGLTGAGS